MEINSSEPVSVKNHDDVIWLQIQEHELFSETQCQEIVQTASDSMTGDAPRVVIDLSKVIAAGSCFFGSLVQIKRDVMDKRGKFAVASPTKFVEQSMRVAGLNRVFPIATSLDDARRKLKRCA